MDRQQFLAQQDVAGFIDWLRNNLPHLSVHLVFSRSRFVKQGIDQHVKGIEAVHALYHWQTSWTDYQTGKVITSGDWSSTQQSLALLRDRLLTGLASGSEADTYRACLGVLQWGGVRGAIPFLAGLQRQSGLVKYLDDCRPLFTLDTNQKLSDLNDRSIWRFDAGLTKIHSLIDTTGSPIYDSRVGAAIAMLYALYRKGASASAVLGFPTGPARGCQVRDPGALGYQRAPQFFSSSVPDDRWARCQLELGWIIQETLTSTNWFSGTPAERCHAFEAALFMLGYDLRCFFPGLATLSTSGSVEVRAPSVAGDAADDTGRASTWVPTSVPFAQVLREYLDCSKVAGRSIDLATYRDWQVTAKKRTIATARAYCAPLRPSELDLPSYSIDSLELIAQGGAAGLKEILGGQERFVAGEEREQVYLVDAFLAARAIAIAGTRGKSPGELLIDGGFAGNEGSSQVLLNIGKAVGRHFGLLDGDESTPLFDDFYGDELADLEERLI